VDQFSSLQLLQLGFHPNPKVDIFPVSGKSFTKQDHQVAHLSRAHLLVSSVFQFLSYFCVVPGRMTTGTKINEKLNGVDNFKAWRYIVTLLEEHELDKFIIEEVQEHQGDEAKEKYKDMEHGESKNDYCILH
jgi:hypothetical protein